MAGSQTSVCLRSSRILQTFCPRARGTAQWVSPELIDPQRFGFEDGRRTKYSDCYAAALGMVIYETISGRLPFHQHSDLTVFVKVLAGERPPRGVGFTGRLWEMLGLCWMYQPNSRPSIEDVLQCLEGVSKLTDPPGPLEDQAPPEVLLPPPRSAWRTVQRPRRKKAKGASLASP